MRISAPVSHDHRRLRHTVKFSSVAVINKETPTYIPAKDRQVSDPGGSYAEGETMLTFQILNWRKRQLCNPILAMKLLKKGTDPRVEVNINDRY